MLEKSYYVCREAKCGEYVFSDETLIWAHKTDEGRDAIGASWAHREYIYNQTKIENFVDSIYRKEEK